MRRDAGETLTELLVTVMVLGIAVTGLLLALATTIRTSDTHRRQALAQNLLRSWAEQVGAGTYTPCATAGSVAAPSPAPAPGLTATVTEVRYWTGTAFAATCGTDTGIQRVTLRVTATGGGAPTLTETVAVVVRRPCTSAC